MLKWEGLMGINGPSKTPEGHPPNKIWKIELFILWYYKN